MNWIKAGHRFDNRAAIFYITGKQAVMDAIEMAILNNCENDPDKLEEFVRDRVLKYRPELSGCTVYHMAYNAECHRWEFAVSHSSLPKQNLWERLTMRPLDPAYEKDMLATAALGANQ
jgi:hypothetical protein